MADQTLGTPDHLFDDAWKSMIDELSGESDRAAAIVGSALLDDRLAELLSEFLVQNEDGRSDLLNSEDTNAPLGSFGARIIAAYAVGLIDQSDRDALRRLKKIRNRFAHSLGVGFTDQAVAAHCEAAHKACPTKNYTGEPRGPRGLFQSTVALLAGRIAERRYLIATFGLKGTFQSVRQAAGHDPRDRAAHRGGDSAEVGVDMSCFPSDRHLASWAGLCPGNHESAGKHKSGKTRKGNRWLRMALIEGALGAIRTKDSALAARYRRVMRHRGHQKAVVAVAHALLRAVYHLLAEGTPYRDPGPHYYDRRHAHRVTRRAIELLERQGYRVVLEPVA